MNRTLAIQKALKMSHHQSLAEFSTLSGVPIESLLDEALTNFIEADIASRIEALARKVATA